MVKFGFAALVATIIATFTVVSVTGTGTADAASPCKAKKIESKMLQDACKAGGQKAAKDAMKKAMKEWKKQESAIACASCHKKVGGDYPLKPDGREHFTKLGGK